MHGLNLVKNKTDTMEECMTALERVGGFSGHGGGGSGGGQSAAAKKKAEKRKREAAALRGGANTRHRGDSLKGGGRAWGGIS